MGIGNISDYNSFLQNYQPMNMKTVQIKTAEEAGGALAVQPAQTGVQTQTGTQIADTHVETSAIETSDIEASAIERKPDAALEDISITFNKQDDFEYIGQESDIHSLDVEKAISDMKKDQVLQQYQYFVGSVRNVFSNNTDGMVIQKF